MSDPYEAPANPELRIESEHEDPAESAERIVEVLEELGLVPERVAA